MTDKNEDPIKKLNSLIKDVQMAMLATIDSGVIRSRPMATQEMDADGFLWFMTSSTSHKIEEIEKDNRVNIAYSAPKDNTYVSVSGTAAIVHDREKIKELWNPMNKAWFPNGVDDPTICLLKVKVDQAEYWDSSSSTVIHIIGFVKATVTGKTYEPGDHGQIQM